MDNTQQERKDDETGYIGDELEEIKKKNYKKDCKLCEGDYLCVVGGTRFTIGTSTRVGSVQCENHVCPNRLNVGDGSSWNFTGNCSC